ncbi:MAG TPA: glucosamine-6-phosphate deaminase [Burkholderiaceae bacterium]|nr:glucosamine-6-phosphate deaminase [Burkholderiaceae bacterium]
MILVFPDTASIANYVGTLLADRIHGKPDVTLGLATGGTMEPVYRHFVQEVKTRHLDVSRVHTFNLDEYIGLAPDHPQSYAAYMQQRLFGQLPFNRAQCHVPNGQAANVEHYCDEYTRLIERCGGIDLQLLGVGTNGHIGFNEPGTPFDSHCHTVQLAEQTRIDNSRFFAEDELVPASAITLGMADIMNAREILLLATGARKAATMQAYVEHEVTPDVPFTLLKRHARARIILDPEAAAHLPADAYQRIDPAALMAG